MTFVTEKTFRAMLTVDVESLSTCPDQELRPVLPSLVRMSLIASLDKSRICARDKTRVLQILSRIELVNNIVALLSINFPALETAVKKEQQLRAKISLSSNGSTTSSASATGGDTSALTSASEAGPAVDFERSDATRRLRLVLSELLIIMGQVQHQNKDETCVTLKTSELFDHVVYLSEICDVLSIALAELPNLLSPPEVAETLLRLQYGPQIICHIVANQPDCFAEVANYLLKNGEKQEEDPFRTKALLSLCRMNPSQTRTIRSRCVELCRMPSLAILLTLESKDDDLIPFVSGLLLGSDSNARSWISIFIRNKKRSDALVLLRKRLVQKLTDLIDTGLKSSKNLVQGSTLLRLFTALRGIGGLKFSDEEITLLMTLITIKIPKIPAGFKFVSLGLCMIIACNSLISTPSLEKNAVSWIRWLVDDFESEAGNVEEMLLLMAIHFHSQQFGAISELACSTLGMKIAIRHNNMNRIKHIFTQEVFTENVVAAHAVKVPVTDKLSADMTGFLPVHCIHQLLKSRAFSKHKVPIKEWIQSQIRVSKLPIHPVLPSLIEVYVNSILIPASNRGNSSQSNCVDQTNEPISEQEVSAIFRSSSTSSSSVSLAPQMLMLYYVLLYDGIRISHMKSIIASNRRVLRYSQNLLAELPLKYLLQTAEKHQERFGGLFPQLLRLCSTHFPHLCSVNDWLDVNTFTLSLPLTSQRLIINATEIDESVIKEAFSELKVSSVKATLVLQRLMELPKQKLWSFARVCVDQLRNLLEPDVPRQIQDLFKRLWFRMNTTFPRKLWVYTVNAMRDDVKEITQDVLIFDPLHVLRCDKRIFRIAPMLEILIYLLRATLAASRTHLTQHIQNNPIVERVPSAQVTSDQEREELRIALIITQDSAAVQILLEAGLSSDKRCLSDTKEIQSLVCSYLHETFINDPPLAKLVHFQGYPLELLPITVAGVPSMHICLDFSPELLSQPDLEKQVFAVDLISHLSVQYALPKSYSTARLAVNALSTLLSVITEEERRILFPPVLPAFVRFCKAFPPLTEDVVGLLLQYGRITVSESCMRGYSSPRNVDVTYDHRDNNDRDTDEEDVKRSRIYAFVNHQNRFPSAPLTHKIQETFAEILKNSILDKKLF